MLPQNHTEPARIAAPTLPAEPRRTPFPLMATLAPVLMSVVLFAITRSPYALMFAALGPGVALASRLDSRRANRTQGRLEHVRFQSQLTEARAELARAHAAERAGRAQLAPSASELVVGPSHVRWGGGPTSMLRIGTTAARSDVRVDGASAATAGASGAMAQLAALQRDAATLLDASLVIEPRRGVAVTGPPALAHACARALVVQLLATHSPATHRVEGGEEWLLGAPHAWDERPSDSLTLRGPESAITIAVTRERAGIPPSVDSVIEVDASGATLGAQRFEPELLSVAQAKQWAAAAAEAALRNGIRGTADGVPTAVAFSELPPVTARRDSLRCPIGRDATGFASVDLVSEGPHAIVGGTTGSGKSELLVTWLLAMAASQSPADLTFLLFDFKGGSSFGALPTLPHCVGIVTDLDEGAARRAVASLAAEIRHRERILASQSARAIEQATGLARLVIVVDEFAVMAAELEQLHEQFADVAARGRSLGMHLVLCTQRPAGVVRDAVLANASLRISLRVNNRADSVALIGTGEAADARAAHPGRAWVARAGGEGEPIHVALATARDVALVAERWPGEWQPRRPWLDPLPTQISARELPSAIGLLDLPSEQAQRPAHWRPIEHGNLLVLGAARSGKSNVVHVIGETLDIEVVAPGIEAAWDALLSASPVILLDDVDLLLAECTHDHQQAFVDLLVAALRSPSRRLALTAQRLTAQLQQLSALCDTRLLLRMPNRQEHVIAGGNSATFDPQLSPGSGYWGDSRIQVALATPRDDAAPASTAELLPQATLLVVSSRPHAIAMVLRQQGREVLSLPLELPCPPGAVVVTDPDGWQANWPQASALAKQHSVVFHQCSVAEFRQLSRERRLPPPIADASSTGWLLEPEGQVRRVAL